MSLLVGSASWVIPCAHRTPCLSNLKLFLWIRHCHRVRLACSIWNGSDVITGWLMRLHLPMMRCLSLHWHMRNIFNSCRMYQLPLLKDRIETRHISGGEPQWSLVAFVLDSGFVSVGVSWQLEMMTWSLWAIMGRTPVIRDGFRPVETDTIDSDSIHLNCMACLEVSSLIQAHNDSRWLRANQWSPTTEWDMHGQENNKSWAHAETHLLMRAANVPSRPMKLPPRALKSPFNCHVTSSFILC